MSVALSLRRVLNPEGLIALLTLSALLLIAPSIQAQQQHIGYVIDMEGRWLAGVNPVRELRKGDQLRARDVIRIESPTPYDYIVIAGFNEDIIARRYCSNAGDCNRPLRLRRPAESSNSILGAILGSVMGLLRGEPGRYVALGQRGDELSEGVVLIKDGRVDLNTVFAGHGGEQYYLRLRAIAPSGKPSANSWIGPIVFNWEPGKSSPVAIQGIEPGLYELALLERSDNEYMPTGSSAWILASGPREYRRLSLSFRRAVKLTRKWGKAITPEAARSFLRADLDHLARTARKR